MEKKKRIVTRIGNVFCVEFDGKYKRYFQYIANDLTYMNSAVIRVFSKRWLIEETPTINEIVNGEVGFYTHTMLRGGIEAGAWYKIGYSKVLGLEGLEKQAFGQLITPDNLVGLFGENRRFYQSKKCLIWYVNEPLTYFKEIPLWFKDKVEVGGIFSYITIVTRISYGYAKGSDPAYYIMPRHPWPETISYVKIKQDDYVEFLEFKGEYPTREVVVKPDGSKLHLTPDNPEEDGFRFDDRLFSSHIFMHPNFITREDFEEKWTAIV